jgi:hypothetical protein
MNLVEKAKCSYFILNHYVLRSSYYNFQQSLANRGFKVSSHLCLSSFSNRDKPICFYVSAVLICVHMENVYPHLLRADL